MFINCTWRSFPAAGVLSAEPGPVLETQVSFLEAYVGNAKENANFFFLLFFRKWICLLSQEG